MNISESVQKSITDWLDFKIGSQGRSLSTIVKYRSYIERLVKYLSAQGRDVYTATEDDLVDFTGLHCHKAGLAPASRKAVVAAVRGFYEFLYKTKQIKFNVGDDLIYPSIGRRVPIAMQLQNSELLLMQPDISSLVGLRDAALIALLIGCGMRVSGLCSLNESNIFAFGSGKEQRYGLRVKEKGGHERVLPLPHEAYILLASYLGHPDLQTIDRTLANGDQVVFVSFRNRHIAVHEYRGEHRRLSKNGVNQVIKKHAEAAGIPMNEAHAHAIRHLLGAEMAENDATLLDMQAQLGHADPKATAIYVQIAIRKRTAMIDKANPLSKIQTPVSPLVRELKNAGAL